MKVLISGSRDASPEMVREAQRVARMCIKRGHEIIVGDAEGVDRAVVMLCNRLEYSKVTVWGAYSKIKYGTHCGTNKVTGASYPLRDMVMARACDVCIGIWNGESTGTLITVGHAKELGKKVKLLRFGQKGEKK